MAYNCANRARKFAGIAASARMRDCVKLQLKTIVIAALGLLALLLLVAWYDGGRQEQRLIEQDIEVPAANPGEGA